MARFPFDLVGFDLDGTLLDTHADLGVALNHALAEAGRPAIPVGEVRHLVGGGSGRMLEMGLHKTGGMVEEPEFNRLRAILLAHYESNISAHSRFFDGGEAMLDALEDRGAKLAVVTNKPEHLAVKLLGELGLSERFFTILGGDSLGPGKAKPAPDLIHEMVARGGGGRAAFVGDTTYDTHAARAAGIPCVVVSFGFCNVPPAEMGADAVVDRNDALVAALERLG